MPLLGTAVVSGVGATVALYRWHTFVEMPKVFRRRANGGTLPDTEAPPARTLTVVGLLWCFDKLVGRLLVALGSSFPSSIVSMLLSVGVSLQPLLPNSGCFFLRDCL